MLKTIGAILVLGAAGGFGISKAMQFYRQLRQLREFYQALELLKCELNYTLLPLPRICRVTAERVRGTASDYLLRYAQKLDEGLPRTKAAAQCMEEVRGLSLPNDAKMALLELFEALGRYDLDGENRLLQMTAHRLNAAIERCEAEKKPLAKGYAALGFCTGLALVILII